MIGTALSHFRITSELGAGGMGEVYRAEDTRLGREVAIKVLPQAFVAEPERLARFEREARVLASLSHPNIAGIYEVGEGDDGVHYLVMELAHGETLAERIARGPIPLAATLSMTLQIAEALESAHERGIVHRDLKPANVMVDAEGQVKVLDFGLARAMEGEPGSDGRTGLTHSPTMTYQATLAGVLLGTAAYMSPEQAAGRAADRRADVWAFGALLFEMLTGRAAFSGETISHVLAGILKDEPPWHELPGDVPPPLRRLLQRCLRKDPRHRLQAIGDARVILEEIVAHPDTTADPTVGEPMSPHRLQGWPVWTAVSLAALTALALVALAFRQQDPSLDQAPLRFELALPQGTELALDHQHDLLALSPDGQRQVFLVRGGDGVRRLALRDLGEMSARVLPGTEDAATPFFSPDGQWIGFFANSKLWRLPVAGGPPTPIADAFGDNRGATWSSDGYIYLAPDSAMPLQRVRETGGSSEPVTELDGTRRERTHRWPQALPSGEVVLFTSDTIDTTEFYDDARIEAVRVATGERTVVVEQASRARYLASGYLVVSRGGTLFAAPFDPEAMALTGSLVVVLQGVATTVASGAAHFAVADTGALLYAPGEAASGASIPVWVDRTGEQQPSGIATGNFDQLTLSPDGQRVALTLDQGGTRDLWVADLGRGTLTRLTFGGSASDPVWHPDGRWIAFAHATGVSRQLSDGSGEPESLWDVQRPVYPSSFSPDGTSLVVDFETATGQWDIGLISISDPGEPTPLVEQPGRAGGGAISPDGRWLAYQSSESGRPEVYVMPMSGEGGRWQISTRTGFEPRWSPDGSELFYRDGVGTLYGVELEPGERFVPGPPTRLLEGMRSGDNPRTYSVTPDGSRFLTLGLSGQRGIDRLDMVLGWDREVQSITGRRR